MLLNHARSTGVSVYEKTKVESVTFSTTDPNTPVSVSWSHTPPPVPLSPPASPIESSFPSFITGNLANDIAPNADPVRGETTFTYLIDATGRAGILSARYFKNRHFNASLKNVAVWGYWRNVGRYGAGTSRYGSPWFETLTGFSLHCAVSAETLKFPFFPRCVWLGLVHPSSRWYHISWCGDERESLQSEGGTSRTSSIPTFQ